MGRWIWAALVTVALAGCLSLSMDPRDLRQGNTPQTIGFAGDYKSAASCVDRALDDKTDSLTSTVRVNESSRSAEVAARVPVAAIAGGGMRIMSVVDIAEREGRTRGEVYFPPAEYSSNRKRVLDALARCG